MPERTSSKDPTLEFEHAARHQGFRYLIGLDEVGRGAVAGPVAVGAVLSRCDVDSIPEGLRDSKLLSEKKRAVVAPRVTEWVTASAVGFASADEVETHGISSMLGEAGRRALLDIHNQGYPIHECLVLLDGSHDWLSPMLRSPLTVRTQPKADRDCATVAAASVLAKVQRDALMRELSLSHPEYGWDSNKGYGSELHYQAIREHGVTEWHRASWIRI